MYKKLLSLQCNIFKSPNVMKTNLFKFETGNKFFAAIAFSAILVLLAACTREPVGPRIRELPPIEYTPEVNDPVTNDFRMVKACIGKSPAEAAAIVNGRNFFLDENDDPSTHSPGTSHYVHTGNGNEKTLSLWSSNQSVVLQGELYVKDQELSVMLLFYKQWLREFRTSTAYKKLARTHFSWGVDGNTRNFHSLDELIAAVDNLQSAEDISISFSGSDIYANEYSIHLSYRDYLKWVELRVLNSRAGQPSDDFTQSDLQDTDLHKNILISKVDYLTFRYKGFYALNVQNPVQTGTEIPFLAEYQAPCDFGWIKLYYQNTDNLLMSGDITWMGCGQLEFPTGFRAGRQLNNRLPYPGQNKISFINDAGTYQTVTDDADLQRIWQTVSKQQEFRRYYANSHKKVAVYLYTPSVGIGNPADWYYLVFIEQ